MRLFLLVALTTTAFVVGAALVYLNGSTDDDGDLSGSTGPSVTEEPESSTDASDDASGDDDSTSDGASDGDDASTSDGGSQTPTQPVLVGVDSGQRVDAGSTVRVQASGVSSNDAVFLSIDGDTVDEGFGDDELEWSATAGSHELVVGAAGTRSEGVVVEVSDLLRPTSAEASFERAPVPRLRCGGSNSFEAELLIDGDDDTGWGASSVDGEGEWIVIDFGRQVVLTEVGLTPGYLRVAPRASQGCDDVLAFPFNRFVRSVEYRFDDGTGATQVFDQRPSMQRMMIESVVTSSVTIIIGETARQTEDNDLILSEALFRGYVP